MVNTLHSDAFTQQTKDFVVWLQRTGTAVSSKIEIADLRERHAGRGVVALEDIGEDEQLFSIPRSAVLTTETSQIPRHILSNLEEPWLSLILAMIFEYQLGTDSSWKPYMDIIPTHFDTLMFWSSAELDVLRGSMVVNKISKEKADGIFTEQLLPLIRSNEITFRSGDLTDAALLALCHRMGSAIMAYAFDLEKTNSTNQATSEEDGWEEDDEDTAIQAKGMVPLADLLNADADRNNAKLFYEDGEVVMKTIRKVAAGEELFNDYGSLPSADLVRRYGYVTDNYAQYDVAEIPADLIRESAQEELNLATSDLDERMAYLDEQGVLDDAYDISRANSEDGQIPEELCVFLNLVTLERPDFEEMQRKEKLPQAELSGQARSVLLSTLKRRFAAYRSDVELQATPPSYRRAMALTVVRGEKTVLREAIEVLSPAIPNDRKRRAEDLVDDNSNAQKQVRR